MPGGMLLLYADNLPAIWCGNLQGIFQSAFLTLVRESALKAGARYESDIETEMHDVAVAHGVFFSFHVHLAGFFHCGLRTECHVVVVFDHFGADESFFEVGVDYSRCLRGFGAAHESPGAYFVGACSEICLQVEQCIGSAYKARHTALFQSYFLEKLVSLFPGVEFGYLAFGLDRKSVV